MMVCALPAEEETGGALACVATECREGVPRTYLRNLCGRASEWKLQFGGVEEWGMVLRWAVCVGWQVENPELKCGCGSHACPTWKVGDLGWGL